MVVEQAAKSTLLVKIANLVRAPSFLIKFLKYRSIIVFIDIAKAIVPFIENIKADVAQQTWLGGKLWVGFLDTFGVAIKKIIQIDLEWLKGTDVLLATPTKLQRINVWFDILAGLLILYLLVFGFSFPVVGEISFNKFVVKMVGMENIGTQLVGFALLMSLMWGVGLYYGEEKYIPFSGLKHLLESFWADPRKMVGI